MNCNCNVSDFAASDINLVKKYRYEFKFGILMKHKITVVDACNMICGMGILTNLV